MPALRGPCGGSLCEGSQQSSPTSAMLLLPLSPRPAQCLAWCLLLLLRAAVGILTGEGAGGGLPSHQLHAEGVACIQPGTVFQV